jgi:hypothetical protein
VRSCGVESDRAGEDREECRPLYPEFRNDTPLSFFSLSGVRSLKITTKTDVTSNKLTRAC